MTQPSVFDSYNATELYQSCIEAGIPTRPDASREQMIAYLEGWEEPPTTPDDDNIFNSWRYGLIDFLLQHWREIETQITCPAKALKDKIKPNPRPCFGCIDIKVVDCLVENIQHIPLIETHRLTRKTRHG